MRSCRVDFSCSVATLADRIEATALHGGSNRSRCYRRATALGSQVGSASAELACHSRIRIRVFARDLRFRAYVMTEEAVYDS